MFAFLFYVVDPFGYRGSKFPNTAMATLQAGLWLAVFLFILKIWIKAALGAAMVRRYYISYIIKGFAFVVFLTCLFTGIFWYNGDVMNLFYAVVVAAAFICTFGFVVFGSQMVYTMRISGNMSASNFVLPLKITVFICSFVAIALLLGIVSCFNLIGLALAQLLRGSFYSVGLVITLLLLIFHKRERSCWTRTRKTSPSIGTPEVEVADVKTTQSETTPRKLYSSHTFPDQSISPKQLRKSMEWATANPQARPPPIPLHHLQNQNPDMDAELGSRPNRAKTEPSLVIPLSCPARDLPYKESPRWRNRHEPAKRETPAKFVNISVLPSSRESPTKHLLLAEFPPQANENSQ